jgi:hypothetical protein
MAAAAGTGWSRSAMELFSCTRRLASYAPGTWRDRPSELCWPSRSPMVLTFSFRHVRRAYGMAPSSRPDAAVALTRLAPDQDRPQFPVFASRT